MKQRYQAFSYIIIAFALQQIKTTYATDNGNGKNNVNYGTDPLLQLEILFLNYSPDSPKI